MRHKRLLYTRSARTRLQTLPAEVRMHLETHLENLVLLVRTSAPERLTELMARGEEGFVTSVTGARVLFVVDTTALTLLIHRIEVLPMDRPVAAPPLL